MRTKKEDACRHASSFTAFLLGELEDVEQRALRRTATTVEDLWTRVEDQDEDDEDEQDDSDDHARAEPTVCRPAGVHIDLTHVDLLSVTRPPHSQAACRLPAVAHSLAWRATPVRVR